MKYKIIGTDFDGTLLNSKGELTEKTKQTLINIKNKGYITVGITGRILSSVKNRIDINLFDYLILCDGTYIYDVTKDEILYASHIPISLAEEITLTMIDKVTEIDYGALNNYYILKGKVNNPSSHVKTIENISQITEPISRMTLFFKTNEEVEHFYKIIKEKYKILNPFIMQDSFSDERRININLKDTNKINTLKLLSSKLNVSLENIIFFGDGLNDLEIFESEVFSIAMSNALKEIKSKANDITLTNDEDGVAMYLEKLLNQELN